MAEPVGRRLRARFAFTGAAGSLERTGPMEDDNRVLLHGALRLRGVGRLRRPAVLRLTERHLAVLAHYALRPDQVWDLPRGSVQDVRLTGDVLEVTWSSEYGPEILRFTRWTGRRALDTPLRDIARVAGVLRLWRNPPPTAP